MKSAALNHFPRVVSEINRFWLFNPILKKRYENRPEERVRLAWIDYILYQTDWKKSRIGCELPVKIRQRNNSLRADLILYSASMKPEILVECKAGSVKLNSSAAVQAARYNTQVDAPYLVLTNGIEDFWFEKKEGRVEPTEEIFDKKKSFPVAERDFEYWHQRGFCSTRTDPVLRDWLTSALNLFWSAENGGKREYLDFHQTVLPVPMNHYYKVFDIDPERKLAISFIGVGSSDSYMACILNLQGVNQKIVTVNLNKMHKNKAKSISLFNRDDSKTVFPEHHLPIQFSNFEPAQIKNLPQYVMNFFD